MSVSIALALCAAGVICVSISVGDFPIPLTKVVPAVFGFGSRDADQYGADAVEFME